MARKEKTEIPADVADEVLFLSDRTCCVCRVPRKPVQIHHIDENPSNSTPDNLAVLCLDCHRETQIRGGFDRKLNGGQVVLYRQDWHNQVVEKRSAASTPSVAQKIGQPQTVHTLVENRVPRSQQVATHLKYVQVRENSEESCYSFAADYPQIEPEQSSEATEINLCIDAFITRILQRFRAEAIARSDHKNTIKKDFGGAIAWDDLSITHKVELFTNDLFSIEFRLATCYAGAAHPNSYTRTLNFRCVPPTVLELDDVFKPKSRYLEVLSEYCITDVCRQLPDQLKLASGDNDWVVSGASPQYANFEKFLLSKGYLQFFFDPYQVGSYAEGRYQVLIPIARIALLLKEPFALLLG